MLKSPMCWPESLDIVFVATGGVPNTDVLESGGDLVVSTWDVLSGAVTPAQRVLIYDDNGAHPAMQAAELLAEAGSAVRSSRPNAISRRRSAASTMPPMPRCSIATVCGSQSMRG